MKSYIWSKSTKVTYDFEFLENFRFNQNLRNFQIIFDCISSLEKFKSIILFVEYFREIFIKNLVCDCFHFEFVCYNETLYKLFVSQT